MNTPDPLSTPQIAILLATFDGQHFLAEQLDSFTTQSYPHWKVWASDDGSTDGTLDILTHYQTQWNNDRLSVYTGPAKGSTANFLALTCHSHIQADYYAYADQDDIWEQDKLARAVTWLKTCPSDTPALYCSRTRLVDANNQEIGLSPLFTRPPHFANAMVQNIAGGNTMVFNHAARERLCMAGQDIPVVMHDWWVYLVVTGCGGHVFYDPTPTVRYRQHNNNLIGENSSYLARLTRLGMLLDGRFRKWNERNIQAWKPIHSYLTPENRYILDTFTLARQRGLLSRIVGIKRSGIYRQTLLGNLGLAAATLLKKL